MPRAFTFSVDRLRGAPMVLKFCISRVIRISGTIKGLLIKPPRIDVSEPKTLGYE